MKVEITATVTDSIYCGSITVESGMLYEDFADKWADMMWGLTGQGEIRAVIAGTHTMADSFSTTRGVVGFYSGELNNGEIHDGGALGEFFRDLCLALDIEIPDFDQHRSRS